ncbi:MAG: MarR family transcriptional regulator [Phycisphaerales bacterium]|nr:MarR family transcriptional regulator [Planctomycetota bacterium]MCH8508917.1 MarR family transcriptional regulator [Phycisphaerales bacterium]
MTTAQPSSPERSNARSPQEECLEIELTPQCELMRAVYIFCHMMMRVVDRAVEPEGLTGSRWHLLIVVRDCGEPLTITQLSERLFLSSQNVSRMIASLEADGLVSRDTSGPGRTVRVALTEHGSARLEACVQLAESCADGMLDGISEEQMRLATLVLERTILNTVALERSLAQNGSQLHRNGEPTHSPEEAP